MSDLLDEFDSAAAQANGAAPSSQPRNIVDEFDAAVAGAKQPPAASAPTPAKPSLLDWMGQQVRQSKSGTLGLLESAAGATTGLLGMGKAAAQNIYDWATGKSPTWEESQRRASDITYEPRSASARTMGDVLAIPAKLGAKAGEKTMEATGSPGLATAADVGVQSIPMLFASLRGKPGEVAQEAPAETAPAATAVAPEGAPKIADGSMTPPQFATKAPPAAPGTAVDLANPAHARRAQVLSQLPLDNVRESAVTGDPQQAALDWQQTKARGEPAGDSALAQFSAERNALEDYARDTIGRSGGTLDMDETGLASRGQTIAGAFDALREFMDQKTGQLYSAAHDRAGGSANISLSGLKNALDTDSNFEGTPERSGLRKGIQAYLREQGITDKDGNWSPVTARQAEGVRQYINSQWQPRTSGLAGSLKGSLDDDVLSGAGEDIYKQARGLSALKKQTLDNPRGTSTLMDYDPSAPVNRAVPYEKIPTYVTSLPLAQFDHVVSTLKNMPPELAPQADAALGEIKAQLGNNVLRDATTYKGAWNNKGASTRLNAQAGKMGIVMTPEEIARWQTLNDAGHILDVNREYPGAAPQASGLIKRGLQAGAPWAGGAVGGSVGGFLGGPLGASAGATAGSTLGLRLSNQMGQAAALKAWQGRLLNAKDLTAKGAP